MVGTVCSIFSCCRSWANLVGCTTLCEAPASSGQFPLVGRVLQPGSRFLPKALQHSERKFPGRVSDTMADEASWSSRFLDLSLFAVTIRSNALLVILHARRAVPALGRFHFSIWGSFVFQHQCDGSRESKELPAGGCTENLRQARKWAGSQHRTKWVCHGGGEPSPLPA